MPKKYLYLKTWFFVICFLSLFLSKSQSTQESLIKEYERLDSLIPNYFYYYPDSALIYGLKQYAIAEKLQDNKKLGNSLRLIGIIYSDLGDYESAIHYLYKAIDYFQLAEVEDKETLIATCYHNLGWFYAFMQEQEKTIPLFQKAIAIILSQPKIDSISLVREYHSLGTFYYLYNFILDSSVFYFTKALAIAEKLGFSEDEIDQIEIELAHAYAESGDIKNAQKIRSLIGSGTSPYVQNYVLFVKAIELEKTGEFITSIALMEQVNLWIDSTGNSLSEIGLNSLSKLIQVAEKAGDYQKAYRYLEKLRQNEKQSIFKNRQRLTKAAEIRNETKLKENLITTQEEKIAKQKWMITIVLLLLFIVLPLLVLLVVSITKIKRKNKKIEWLMKELHHRVKNNLQVISSLLGLQSSQISDHSAQKAILDGKQRIRAMSLIHQKLYQQENISALDIHEYFQSLVRELSESFGFNEKCVDLSIPKVSFDADTTLPLGLIANELITNALKYAFTDIEKPLLKLELTKYTDKEYRLIIEDNGPGLPPNFVVEQSRSFGLRLVHVLLKQIRGKMDVLSAGGLKYTISFPVNPTI